LVDFSFEGQLKWDASINALDPDVPAVRTVNSDGNSRAVRRQRWEEEFTLPVGIDDFNLFLPGFVAGEPGPSGVVP